MQCHAEMCLNWTGQGCACLVMDIEPDLGSAVDLDSLYDDWKPVTIAVRADEGTTDADPR